MAECSKGWGKRCPASKGPKCRCACGGLNHGGMRPKPGETLQLTPERELYYRDPEQRTKPKLEEINVEDTRVIEFVRKPRDPRYPNVLDGEAVILLDGAPLVHRYVRHSPTGMEFGYGGSGPADAALNILALVIPVKEATRHGLYHDFKFRFIATAAHGATLSLQVVRSWLLFRYAREDHQGESDTHTQAVQEGATPSEYISA